MTTHGGEGRLSALLPALVVAAAWPVLWLAWAPLGRTAHDARRPPRPFAPRVSCVWNAPGTADLPSSPMLIQLPTAAGAETLRDGKPDVAPLAVVHTSPVGLLEFTSTGQHATPEVMFEDLQGRLAARQNGYTPAPADRPVYDIDGFARAEAISVQVSGGLRECGFAPGALIQECASAISNRCSVSAYLEADELGSVGNVFLETSTDNPKLNATLVRALMQGRTANPGRACGGIVSITFSGSSPESEKP